MQDGVVQSALSDTHFYLRFCGDVRLPWCVTLETFCKNVIATNQITALSVDLTQAENLDSTTLGILAKVVLLASRSLADKPVLHCIDDNIYRLLWSMGFEHISTIERVRVDAEPSYTDIQLIDCDEVDVRASVIGAHEQLMDIDERNITKFNSLVDSLKKEPKG